MKIKNIINKFLSAFCAVLISFVTVHPVLTFSVFAVGAGAVIGSVLDFADYACQVIDIVSSVYTETPGGLNQAKYLCAWMDMIKDSGISESDFKAYYEEIISRSEEWALGSDEYNTYLFIQDTAANGVSLDAICYMAYHDTGTDDYTIVENDGGKSDLVVSGKGLKDMAADYNSRYIPIANPDEYYWSYQESSVTKSTSKNYYGFFEFTPLPPIYTYTRGTWGNMGWSDLYILAYLEDDDVGCYYSGQYIHFYPSKSDDITYLNIDYYSLSDNTLTYHAAVTWPTDRPYIALQPNSVVYTFPSHYDYLVNTNFKSLYSPSSSSPYKEFCYLYNGSVSSKTKYVYSSSFDPVNNTSDDCGFILSNRPFELFSNQTNISFDRIPDNYVITINGDTIYDYSITNPDTGDSTTINNYITNNYTIPSSDDPTNPTDPTDPSDPTSPSITGNVIVSGNVDVSGKIEIDTKPIDINVNVNGGSSGTVEGVQFDQDVSLNNYYNWMNDQTTGFSAFMSQVLSWLPPPIITLLCAGFACVIIARFLGR